MYQPQRWARRDQSTVFRGRPSAKGPPGSRMGLSDSIYSLTKRANSFHLEGISEDTFYQRRLRYKFSWDQKNTNGNYLCSLAKLAEPGWMVIARQSICHLMEEKTTCSIRLLPPWTQGPRTTFLRHWLAAPFWSQCQTLTHQPWVSGTAWSLEGFHSGAAQAWACAAHGGWRDASQGGFDPGQQQYCDEAKQQSSLLDNAFDVLFKRASNSCFSWFETRLFINKETKRPSPSLSFAKQKTQRSKIKVNESNRSCNPLLSSLFCNCLFWGCSPATLNMNIADSHLFCTLEWDLLILKPGEEAD